MRNLINDLLNFSRVSRSREPYVPTDLNDVMMSVIDDFELVIEEKKAGVVADRLPVLEAVPLQMNQLFQNLLSNSLKFTAPGRPPRVSVRAEHLSSAEKSRSDDKFDPAADYVRITWRDNGIGFEPQFTDKIFTIFQRLHTREEYEGTGIGLALCKKIVDAHGGEIFAVSSDQGAEFRITLPVKQPSAVATTQSAA
jgi:two-component system CheB/CheR fusion protein